MTGTEDCVVKANNFNSHSVFKLQLQWSKLNYVYFHKITLQVTCVKPFHAYKQAMPAYEFISPVINLNERLMYALITSKFTTQTLNRLISKASMFLEMGEVNVAENECLS